MGRGEAGRGRLAHVAEPRIRQISKPSVPKTADPRAPPATTTTAVVVFDPEQPRFIYETVDPDTGTVFYVGRTNDIVRRSDEHDKSKYKIREILKLKNYKFKDIVRPVRSCPEDATTTTPPSSRPTSSSTASASTTPSRTPWAATAWATR